MKCCAFTRELLVKMIILTVIHIKFELSSMLHLVKVNFVLHAINENLREKCEHVILTFSICNKKRAR